MVRLLLLLLVLFVSSFSMAQDCNCEDKDVKYESLESLNSKYFKDIFASFVVYFRDTTVAPDLCPAQCWLKKIEEIGLMKSKQWGNVSFDDIKNNADIAFVFCFFNQFREQYNNGIIPTLLANRTTEDKTSLRCAIGSDFEIGLDKIKEDKEKMATPICKYGDCDTPLKDYYKGYYLSIDAETKNISCYKRNGSKYINRDGSSVAKQVVVITPKNIDSLVEVYKLAENEYKPYFDTISMEILLDMTMVDLSVMKIDELAYYAEYWSYNLVRLMEAKDYINVELLCSLDFGKYNEKYVADRCWYLYFVSLKQERYNEACRYYYDYIRNLNSENPFLLSPPELIMFRLADADCVEELEYFLLQKIDNVKKNDTNLNSYYVQFYLLIIDYLMATSSNNKYKASLEVLYSKVKNAILSNNAYYSNVDWKKKWFKYECQNFLEGEFSKCKSIEQIKDEISTFCSSNGIGKEFSRVCIAEYLCLYGLYQYAHKTSIDPEPYIIASKGYIFNTTYYAEDFARVYLNNKSKRETHVLNWTNLKIVGEDSVVVNNEHYYTVSGFVSDPQSVVKVNGRVATVVGDKFDRQIAIGMGINRIVVECKSSTNKIESKTIIVNNVQNDPFILRKDRALLFAVDEFNDPQWSNLAFPIRDAEQFATYLVGYGFDTCIVRNPTEQEFRIIMQGYKTYYETDTNSCNQLLVFFAGHGSYDPDYGTGAIVLKDGQVPYAGIANMLNNLNCPHILAIFDACHSGSFFNSQKRNSLGPQGSEVMLSNLRIRSKLCTRLFIASGGEDQEVPDESKLMPELFSLFKIGNEFVTYADIVQTVSKIAKPEPRNGDFGKSEPGAVFFFQKKRLK